MSECKVFYEEWQYDCCGKAFKVGDIIQWPVLQIIKKHPDLDISGLKYYYDGHNSYWQMLSILSGKVKEIQAMGKILGIKPVRDKKEVREVRVQFEDISNAAREDIVQYIFEDERKRRSRNNSL